MLLGEYRHNVDVKGRVSVPSKFRDDLGQSFVVTKGLDNCLFMYSKAEWETFEEKLKQLPLTNADARTFIRFFFAGATEVEVDKQGRINIPQVLRDYAGIKKDVVIAGVATRAEIWDSEAWDKYTSSEALNVSNIASQMSNLGI
ncbi:MAG: division/cell wall cluster transcriptional repressor MraZ [Clostridia bacterium]|jgi:MraZ protein|nr:division/cell wall cluster transcriptional repressor MraZ [Clostridia bacterium]